MTTTTEIFTTTRKNKNAAAVAAAMHAMGLEGTNSNVTTTTYKVTSETIELTAQQQTTRWFKAFGHAILSVRKVQIQCAHDKMGEVDWNSGYLPVDSYIEIETANAIGCIVEFKEYSDVQGVVLKRSTKRERKAFTLGTWRKYNGKRGHGMAWSRLQVAKGLSTSPETSADICAAQAYDLLAGGRANLEQH